MGVALTSAGLGAEFARQLAAKGLVLVLVARREEKLTDFKQGIQERFPDVNVRLIAGDLSQPTTPQAIAEKIST
jgi:short-subunit dehydrogenase